MSLFNFLGRKRPKEDFLRSDPKKLKLSVPNPLPPTYRQTGLPLLNRNDSGLDGSGLDKSTVSCGTRLVGDYTSLDNLTPMHSLDGEACKYEGAKYPCDDCDHEASRM